MSETAKKVFIRTFGCQMNDYDSDKMADVLRAAEGYEPTNNVDEADLILFNTCSVREKAQEKVFSDLGRVKHLKKNGVLIGVGGCVASQEGAAIIERAPYVDIVRRLVAFGGAQHVGHLVRVVVVHLAAEGADEDLARQVAHGRLQACAAASKVQASACARVVGQGWRDSSAGVSTQTSCSWPIRSCV